jgi:hypothetical protein
MQPAWQPLPSRRGDISGRMLLPFATFLNFTGGLRIGKQMNERKSDETYDDRLEWDRGLD